MILNNEPPKPRTLTPESVTSSHGEPAVEAGRLTDQPDPGDECLCMACQSDMAGIYPCERGSARQ